MTLVELSDVTQEAGGSLRRWFRGDHTELVTWQDDQGLRRYQLRYHGEDRDLVVEWKRGRPGLRHYALDNGESRSGRAKATPVLRPIDSGDVAAARAAFDRESEGLDPALRAAITRSLDPAAREGPDEPGAW